MNSIVSLVSLRTYRFQNCTCAVYIDGSAYTETGLNIPHFKQTASHHDIWPILLFPIISVPQVATNQRDTRRGKKMVLKNCYSTAVDKLVMRYTNGQELWMQEINTALYDWCLETKKARNNKSVRLNSCNVFDENQVSVCEWSKICVVKWNLSGFMLCYLARQLAGQIETNAESNLNFYSFLHNWPGIRFDWHR